MYKIPNFCKDDNLCHVFSTFEDLNMSYKYGDEKIVTNSRKRFLKKNGLDYRNCIALHLVHGDKIADVGINDIGAGILNLKKAIIADGLITTNKNVFLFMVVADCMPIIFYDPAERILGLLHVSRVNSELKICRKMIKLMTEKYHSISKNIIVGIGPCIRKDSYVYKGLPKKSIKYWSKYLEWINRDTCKIDMVRMNIDQMLSEGVLSSNINDCRIDVVKDDRFYSHFQSHYDKNIAEGRFSCVVGLT